MIVTFKATPILPDFTELEAPVVTRDREGRITVERKLMSTWAERHRLQRLLIGNDQALSGGNLEVTLPHAFTLEEPDLPDSVLCARAAVKPFDQPTGGNQEPGSGRPHVAVGEGAVECGYATIEVDYNNEPFFWGEHFDLAGEAISAGGSKGERIYWRSDKEPVAGNVQRPIIFKGKGRWDVVYHCLRYLPAEVISLCAGCVNSETMTSLHLLTTGNAQYEFTAGQVLYVGGRITELGAIYEILEGGDLAGVLPAYRVELAFDLDAAGHNTFFRAGHVDGSGKAIGDALSILTAPPDTFADYDPYISADLRTLVGQA